MGFDWAEESKALDWAQAVSRTRSALIYWRPKAHIHQDLVRKGWEPEQAHFIIRAAQFIQAGLYPQRPRRI